MSREAQVGARSLGPSERVGEIARLKAWTGKGPGSWPGCEKMAGRRMNPSLK